MTMRNTVLINGPALRALRNRDSVKPAEFAERIGADRSTLTNIELGKRRSVSPALFNRIVAALALEDRRAIMLNPYGDELPWASNDTRQGVAA